MIIFRDDDVFCTESPTQGRVMHSMEKFIETHEILARRKKKHMLAIIANEIENYPELVKYILDRKEEFDFGVHGWAHHHYANWDKEPIKRSLEMAKNKIEGTFGVTCEWFFPPWNERTPAMFEACAELGLKLNDSQVNTTAFLRGETNFDAICFHFWSDGQRGELARIVNSL